MSEPVLAVGSPAPRGPSPAKRSARDDAVDDPFADHLAAADEETAAEIASDAPEVEEPATPPGGSEEADATAEAPEDDDAASPGAPAQAAGDGTDVESSGADSGAKAGSPASETEPETDPVTETDAEESDTDTPPADPAAAVVDPPAPAPVVPAGAVEASAADGASDDTSYDETGAATTPAPATPVLGETSPDATLASDSAAAADEAPSDAPAPDTAPLPPSADPRPAPESTDPAAARTAAAAPAAPPSAPANAPRVAPPPPAPPPPPPPPPEPAAAFVTERMRTIAREGGGEARLHLRPPELGAVSLRVVVEDGRVRATIEAERVDVADKLRKHGPDLRDALAEEGFTIDELAIGAGGADEGSGSGARRDARAARFRIDGAIGAASSDSPDHLGPPRARATRRVGPGGVDVFA